MCNLALKHPFLFKKLMHNQGDLECHTNSYSICSEHKTLCHPSIKSRQRIHQKRRHMIKFTLNKIVEIILTVLSTKEIYFLDCMKKFLCIYSPHPILKLLKAKFSIFTCTTHQVSHTNLFHSPHTFDICSSEKS